MTKPPIPDNSFTDFLNSVFGALDPSLLAMVMISTAFAAVYLGAAAHLRRGVSKSMDLAFALAIASPITGLLVLGRSGLVWGLITGGFALVIGLFLWGTARGKPTKNQPGNIGRAR
ncbi:hypothetical protein [Paenarthrobacter sp. NPDC058040]|uniref:hypothetical protein n=1 Tax=unclassified Paenarthrobacter TaxID=2634190 RepID=UPI0036DE7C8A